MIETMARTHFYSRPSIHERRPEGLNHCVAYEWHNFSEELKRLPVGTNSNQIERKRTNLKTQVSIALKEHQFGGNCYEIVLK